MEFNLENPLTNFQDFNYEDTETIESLFLVESEHMPSQKYLNSLKAGHFDISVRGKVISSSLQFSSNFDPFLSYLASNYMDRFLSTQEMLQPKPWLLKLLGTSCISLASKMMRKTELMTLTDFQGDEGLIFDTQTLKRMEYLILGALKWRMRSITPFSFLCFFGSLFKLKDPPLLQALKARATQFIFKAQNELKLLEFKPSIISASALVCASHELFPLQFPCFIRAISNCSYVNKETMMECYNVIQEIEMEGYESGFDTLSSSDTPVNVLDRRFDSIESDKTTIMTNAAAESERELKKRKISGYYNDDHSSVQLPQIQQSLRVTLAASNYDK